MPDIQLTQGTVHYREEGEGPAVVFIHGLLVNGRVWDDVMPHLGTGVRRIVPDLPLGSHPTPMNDGAALDPPALARMIAELICNADLHKFRAGLHRLEQLFAAAGAREIILPLPRGVRPEQARRRDLRLMAFHPLGTARADARPTHGVVDSELQLHDARGVYVADGAAVPSALGVNPQLTIMALATRFAHGVLERAGVRTSNGRALDALAG